MDELKVLSSRVKKMRLIYGVSQTDMAKAIGVSQTNLSNMEAGRTAITVQNLFKIQKVLGCTMADFFVDFDNKEGTADANPDSSKNKNASTIELEDAINILKLLKSVDVKGL